MIPIMLYKKWAEERGIFMQPSDVLSEEIDGVWSLQNVDGLLVTVENGIVENTIAENTIAENGIVDDEERLVQVSRPDDHHINIKFCDWFGLTILNFPAECLLDALRPIFTDADVKVYSKDWQAKAAALAVSVDVSNWVYSLKIVHAWVKLDETQTRQLFEGLGAVVYRPDGQPFDSFETTP